MATVGDTVAVAPVGRPLSHVTVPAQAVTVKVVLVPAHIAGFGLLITGAGFGLTVTVLTTVPTQPAAVVQVAV